MRVKISSVGVWKYVKFFVIWRTTFTFRLSRFPNNPRFLRLAGRKDPSSTTGPCWMLCVFFANDSEWLFAKKNTKVLIMSRIHAFEKSRQKELFAWGFVGHLRLLSSVPMVSTPISFQCPRPFSRSSGPRRDRKAHKGVGQQANVKGCLLGQIMSMVWNVSQMKHGFHWRGMNAHGQGQYEYLWTLLYVKKNKEKRCLGEGLTGGGPNQTPSRHGSAQRFSLFYS